MKKLLGLLGTITIAGSGTAGIIGNAPAPAKNEINYLQTNNLETLNRTKRNIIGLPEDAKKMCIHNLGSVDFYGSSNGAYAVRHGSNRGVLINGTAGKKIIKIDVYSSARPHEYNVYFVVEDNNKIKNLEVNLKNINNKLSNFKIEKNKLNQDLIIKQSELDNLKTNHAHELSAKQRQTDIKQNEINQLKTDLENNKLKLNNSDLKIKNLENQLNDSNTKVNNLQNKLDKVNSEKNNLIKEKENKLNELNLKIQDLENQLNDSNKKIQNLEQEKLLLNNSNNLNIKLNEEINELKNKNQELEKKIKEIENQNKLQTSKLIIEILKENSKQLNTIKEDNDKLIEEKENALNKVNLNLKTKENRIIELEKELNKTNLEKNKIEKELGKLNEEKKELKDIIFQFTSLDPDQFLKTVVKKYENQITSLNVEIVNLLGTICPR